MKKLLLCFALYAGTIIGADNPTNNDIPISSSESPSSSGSSSSSASSSGSSSSSAKKPISVENDQLLQAFFKVTQTPSDKALRILGIDRDQAIASAKMEIEAKNSETKELFKNFDADHPRTPTHQPSSPNPRNNSDRRIENMPHSDVTDIFNTLSTFREQQTKDYQTAVAIHQAFQQEEVTHLQIERLEREAAKENTFFDLKDLTKTGANNFTANFWAAVGQTLGSYATTKACETIENYLSPEDAARKEIFANLQLQKAKNQIQNEKNKLDEEAALIEIQAESARLQIAQEALIIKLLEAKIENAAIVNKYNQLETERSLTEQEELIRTDAHNFLADFGQTLMILSRQKLAVAQNMQNR